MYTDIEHIIGYCFKDKAVLKEALTHKSFAGEHRSAKHNERLEFLGDSILGAIVADYIYNQCPHVEEGVLSKIKSNLVSRRNLYLWGKQLNLGQYMSLGHGELATGGRERDSIISNAVEAVIGAVYIDGGYGSGYFAVGQNPGAYAGRARFQKRIAGIFAKTRAAYPCVRSDTDGRPGTQQNLYRAGKPGRQRTGHWQRPQQKAGRTSRRPSGF